jgi:hypothetical protein
MRKCAFAAVILLAITGPVFAGHRPAPAKEAKTFTGEVMDSACAKMNSHDQMEQMEGIPNDPKQCTLKCLETGSRLVLQDTAKNITYQLDDQGKAKPFAGQKVKISGSYDAKTKTIHVEKIEAAK